MNYRMIMGIVPVLFLCSTMVTACSTQDWYKGAQSAHALSCQKLPKAEYDNCMKESSKSYNSYKKDLKQLNKPAP